MSDMVIYDRSYQIYCKHVDTWPKSQWCKSNLKFPRNRLFTLRQRDQLQKEHLPSIKFQLNHGYSGTRWNHFPKATGTTKWTAPASETSENRRAWWNTWCRRDLSLLADPNPHKLPLLSPHDSLKTRITIQDRASTLSRTHPWRLHKIFRGPSRNRISDHPQTRTPVSPHPRRRSSACGLQCSRTHKKSGGWASEEGIREARGTRSKGKKKKRTEKRGREKSC